MTKPDTSGFVLRTVGDPPVYKLIVDGKERGRYASVAGMAANLANLMQDHDALAKRCDDYRDLLTWPAAVRIFGLHAQSNTRSLLGGLLAILGLLGVQTPGRVF
jgi:hypothetical protein